MATQSWMRATERDRARTVDILCCARTGRQNSAELDELAKSAFQVRTLGGLRGLIAEDLARRLVAPQPSDVPWQPGTSHGRSLCR